MGKSANEKLRIGRAAVTAILEATKMENNFTDEMIVLGCLRYLDDLGTRRCKSIKCLENWGSYLEESLGEVLSEEQVTG